MTWKDYFSNKHHDLNEFLAAIAQHEPSIPEPYEEKYGQPPTHRSVEAIPHINGIVKTITVFSVDHEGGTSIQEPPEQHLWQDTAAQRAPVLSNASRRILF